MNKIRRKGNHPSQKGQTDKRRTKTKTKNKSKSSKKRRKALYLPDMSERIQGSEKTSTNLQELRSIEHSSIICHVLLLLPLSILSFLVSLKKKNKTEVTH